MRQVGSLTFEELSQVSVLIAFVVMTVFTMPAALGLLLWSYLPF